VMKRISLATALAVALAGVAFAGPKDKTQQTLVNPDSLMGTAPWDNTAVDTKVKFGACKQQIQFKAKDTPALIGTSVVCISSGDTFTNLGLNAGNSLVQRATVDSKGKLKAKADLRSIGCGLLAKATTINSELKCYVDTGWDAATECSSQGGLWIAPNSQVGTEKFKPGDLDGLCQGLTFGFRLVPPSGQLLAEMGVYTGCKTCP